VNDGGQVVGQSAIASGQSSHAFSWTPESGMIDLGTVGGCCSGAQAVTDSGQVVGSSQSVLGGAFTPSPGRSRAGWSASARSAGASANPMR
jgi:probable HAF family extracellular repeat protein